MRTSKQVKHTGWFQLICGLFLFILMSVVTYNVAPIMLGAKDPVHSFSGTFQQAVVFLGIISLVNLFGLINIIIGIWHIKTGRRNKFMTFIILGLAVILFASALWVQKNYGGK